MGKAMTMMMMAGGSNRRNEYDRQGNYDRQGGEGRRSEYDRQGGEGRRNEYDRQDNYDRRSEMESRQSEMESRRNEYSAENRYPIQYPRDEMAEMRRRRDKRGRYMGDEGEQRRSGLYDGGDIGYRTEDRRNAIEGGKRQQVQAGGTFWMQPPEGDEEFDKEAMMKWVKHMRDDEDEPIEPWTPEEIKPLARRFGYPASGEDFDDFYTAIHMMKSDYCAVAEEFDVDTPAFYAALADSWLKDPDAKVKGRKKLEAYHKHIVKGK